MTPLCWTLVAGALLIGAGLTLLLWTVCRISGAHAEAEHSLEESDSAS